MSPRRDRSVDAPACGDHPAQEEGGVILSAITVYMVHEWSCGRRVVPSIGAIRMLPEMDRASFFMTFVPAFNRWMTTTIWN